MSSKGVLDRIQLGKRSAGLELNHQQMIAVCLAFGVIAASILSVILVFMSHAEALAELNERQDRLERLQTAYAQRAKNGKTLVQERDAPDSAFLSAMTAGLAGAQLQTRLTDLVALQNANVASSGILNVSRGDEEVIRLQATFDMKLIALQKLLYDLETGTPYMFVDALSVQQSNAHGVSDDPLLHVTMTLRAIWRRTS